MYRRVRTYTIVTSVEIGWRSEKPWISGVREIGVDPCAIIVIWAYFR